MKIFLAVMACIILSAQADAQSRTTKTKAAKSKKLSAQQHPDSPLTLNSVSDHQGRASKPVQHFSIADPTVLSLNERARGNHIRISNSGIVGMPKRAYGFANGRLLLRSTGATSSGSTGGTASVGTGGSLSAIGGSGPFIGLNGKSPEGGNAMWGTARGLYVSDSNYLYKKY